MRKLFLSPLGRISRISFMIGIVALAVLYTIQHFIYPVLGNGLFGFILPMVFFFFNLHIIFCIYGKRLHDMGRSLWPLFGMFLLLFIVAILVGLKYGMLEYFEAVHSLMNDPVLQKDPESLRAAIKPLEETYQQTLRANMPKIAMILAAIPLAFTAWLAIRPGQKADNRYGPDPVSNPAKHG